MKKFVSSLCLSLCLAPITSHALIIDLESVSHGGFTSVETQGFNIIHTGSFAAFRDDSGQGGTDFSGNGTMRLVAFNTSTITLNKAHGGLFDLLGFDGGESWVQFPHGWATHIKAQGFYAGGNTEQLFELDLIKDPYTGMENFVTNDLFKNLTSVQFTGVSGNPEFSLDNLHVTFLGDNSSTVPIPNTLALMFMMLGWLGLRMRKRVVIHHPIKLL